MVEQVRLMLCGEQQVVLQLSMSTNCEQGGVGQKQPSRADLLSASTAGVACKSCKESDQINFFLARAPSTGESGHVLPWIERSADKK